MWSRDFSSGDRRAPPGMSGRQEGHMLYVTVIGALFLTWFVLVLLFTPALNYRMRARVPVSSPDFLHFLESTCMATTHGGNRAEVFTNGPSFYPAMIAAIRAAEKSVNLECYIF